MAEGSEKLKFDIKQFRAELTQLRDSFGENSFITHGIGSTPDGNRQKEENAKRDYEKILDLCADALLQADDKVAVVRLVSEEVVNHCYLNGYVLLMQNGETKFWQDITVKLAEKASGAVEATATAQGTGETQGAATRTTAITARVEAAAHEVVQETGRNFLQAYTEASKNSPHLDRQKFMRVGDYVEALRVYARDRFRLKIPEGKDPNEAVKIRITKITPKGALGTMTEIEVELDGQTSIVDGSLFYDIGTPGH